MTNLTVVAAVNNRSILQQNLLASPGLQKASQFVFREDARCIGTAYNSAIECASNDLMVFAHQDMYFPAGWLAQLEAALEWLEDHDSSWGVLGVFGVSSTGARKGYLYSTGLRRVIGGAFSAPFPVRALDEVVLVMRKSSGLRFDEKLPGFHLYGTDICLESLRKGLSCYTISAFCIHNTNGIKTLPFSFWRSYMFLRDKWWGFLPVTTPCTEITRGCTPIAISLIRSLYSHALCKRTVGVRTQNPATVCEESLVEQLNA